MRSKRVILKFGSGILTRTDRAEMDQVQLARLVEAIADLKSRGHAVVVMSSGAVSSGLKPLGFKERPDDIVTLQACAAVGQTHLMHAYESFLRTYGLHVAQLLLTHEDLETEDRAERVKATLERLLAFDNTVPVINENDSHGGRGGSPPGSCRCCSCSRRRASRGPVRLLQSPPGPWTPCSA